MAPVGYLSRSSWEKREDILNRQTGFVPGNNTEFCWRAEYWPREMHIACASYGRTKQTQAHGDSVAVK